MFRLLGKIIKYILLIALVLLLLLSIIPYFIKLRNEALNTGHKPFPNSRFMKVENNFMHYRVFEPEAIKDQIILLHGFSGSSFTFRKQIDTLVKNNVLVLAVDWSPFGYSSKQPETDFCDTTTIGLIHKIIKATEEEFDLKGSWIGAGHSMGAGQLCKLVTKYPALIRKQVFIDGFYYSKFSGDPAAKLLMFPPFLKWSDVLAENYFVNESKFSEILETAYLRKPSTEETEGYMKPYKLRNSGSAVIRWANVENYIEVDRLAVYAKPTLMIWGKKDTWIPFDPSIVDTTAFKNIKFKFIPEGGHNCLETHSEVVNKYLIDFIKE